MPLEVGLESAICYKCGQKFGRRKGNIPVSYQILYKGIGYMPYCKNCIDSMYSVYLNDPNCDGAPSAVRQVCRKLDLYWNKQLFDAVMRKSTTQSVMTQYMAKLNGTQYAGKSYDNTLIEERALWSSVNNISGYRSPHADQGKNTQQDTADDYLVTDDVVSFWGPGLSDDMYFMLEQRFKYWMSKYPEGTVLDAGTEALLRQICNIEIDINRDRADGKSIDKSVNALNTLLGSIGIKPVQKREDTEASLAATPMGVWLYRYENKRPLPETESKLKDNKIKRYVFTWMGHVAKMMGKDNVYTKMYDEEVNRLRVEHPEYEDDDDEDLLIDSYSIDDVDNNVGEDLSGGSIDYDE